MIRLAPNADPISRRRLLSGMATFAAATGSMAVLPGCPTGDMDPPDMDPPNLDIPILNFALNLEYLEAEFYARALDLESPFGGSGAGEVIGGRPVPFTRSYWYQYALEIAQDEIAHVNFLRAQLGSRAVDRPVIDFTNAFDAAGQAAGLGSGFDPFADEDSFLLGAFLFEDVGVTAYKGAAKLITNPGYLEAAAGIMAVEAYHAAIIRTTIWNTGDPDVSIDIELGQKDHAVPANAVSDARDSLDGVTDLDQGLSLNGMDSNIVPANADGIVYSRSVAQVLNIVYLNPAKGVTSGGFFPQGVNNSDSAFRTT